MITVRVKKTGYIILMAFMAVLLCSAGQGDDALKKAYIRVYKDISISEMNHYGIPASITLAQGILESRSGTSPLATKGNNHFGIKCHGWNGRTMTADDDARRECFRAYDKAADSFRDHSLFLRGRDRYASLFLLEPTDYKAWAYGLSKAGYATDPQYAPKLINLIEEYQLYQYDLGQTTPPAPSVIEEPVGYTSSGREHFTISLSRELYSKNGVPFVYAMEGETYQSIAAEYDLFMREILSYNDVRTDGSLLSGTIVYLQAKKKDAAKGLDVHIVEKEGETLWDISQRFGVKLSALLKKNKISGDYVPKEGDVIVLRGRGVKQCVLQ